MLSAPRGTVNVLADVGWYIVLAILKQALAEAPQARAEASAV